MIEDHHQDALASPQPEGRGSGHHPVVATVLAALCVLVLVGGIVLGVVLQGKSDDIGAQEQDEVAVRAAAQRFTDTWNTFSADGAQAYVDQVSPLLSTKFRAQFTDAATDVVSGIQQQQLSSKGAVLEDKDEIPLVGVATMDGDSAEVLVVADAQRTSNGQKVLRHWRWQLHMVKVDGTWLVDGFDEI